MDRHALAALLLACKFQEVGIHTVEEFVVFGAERHDSASILRAELDICAAAQRKRAPLLPTPRRPVPPERHRQPPPSAAL